MKFRKLCMSFNDIESTRSRLEMSDILTEIFKGLDSDESAIVCYLIKGKVTPAFIPVEFNISEKTLLKILESISERGQSVSDMYNSIGDLGEVAELLISKLDSKAEGFDVLEVYDSLWNVAEISGQGSVDSRSVLLRDLLVNVSPVEAKYLVRLLINKMRLGVADKSILDGLSGLYPSESEVKSELERAFGVCSDMGYVAATLKDDGVVGVSSIKVIPGIPIASMLASREKDFPEVISRISNPIVQPKFDGLRCQIHVGVKDEVCKDRVWWDRLKGMESQDQVALFGDVKGEKSVKLYSRNLEELTDMFPEVVEAAKSLNVESVIFDSEVVGWDSETESFIGFQATMTRRRKYGVKAMRKDVPVKAFVFDVLYLDGEQVMDKTNEDRMELLNSLLDQKDGVIVRSESEVVDSEVGLKEYFESEVAKGLEGVMIKDPASKYRPDSRGYDWIKLKRAYRGHLADSVDLVVMGYNLGRGRQVDFGIGSILCGVYDESTGNFLTLAKVGTGVTDDQWIQIKKDLDRLKAKDKPKYYNVSADLNPDVWVDPKIVVTVEADELTKSPSHSAGYALRFPRLKVWGRDKVAEKATSLKEVRDLYSKQL